MPHGKPDFSNVSAPVLGHFGTNDDFISVEDAKALEQEIRDASGGQRPSSSTRGGARLLRRARPSRHLRRGTRQERLEQDARLLPAPLWEPARRNEHSGIEDRFETSRLEAFSDGVFAIANTLLVLNFEIQVGFGDLWAPSASSGRTTSATSSFLTIGGLRLIHHAVMRLRYADT